MRYQRIFTIVLDSLGIGAMEDSPEYGDVGVDTLGHIAACRGHLQIPNLKRLGIANLKALHGVEPVESPLAAYMRLREKSCGKGGERLALSDFEAPQGMWKDPGIFPRTFLKDHFPQGSFSFPRKMWRNLVTAWS